eukprot:TRINITY_DN8784_c0_g1_i1.p2 TRINITY_DN8784_c0_g1~~TRINITY_DN8784_c0_g1_i1.p2  ORF type:complete len:135 (-),score=32.32 TRINITY_DN8784_c0_g1_i1:63-467(-)
MVKFLKSSRVVIVTQGRYAGAKAVIVQAHDNGNAARNYGHAVVVGVEKFPLPVTRSMNKKKVARRTRVKPFVKTLNYNHILPTRYSLADMKVEVEGVTSKDPAQRKVAERKLQKVFQERYNSGKNKWFFTKLRF